MDDDKKIEKSVENNAIEMPFTEDTDDIFAEYEEQKEEQKPIEETIPFEETKKVEEVKPAEEIKTEEKIEPVVEEKEKTPVGPILDERIINNPIYNINPKKEEKKEKKKEPKKEDIGTGPIIDERILKNPIYKKTTKEADVEDKVGSGLSLSDNSNLILDDRIKNNPAYQEVSFYNADTKVASSSDKKDVVEKDKKSLFSRNIFAIKHKSILLPVVAFVFASIIGIYLFVSSSKAEIINLIKINETNKIGYMDSDGTIVVKPKYLSGTDFYYGYAIVKNDNNLFCVLNGKGVFEVPCGNYTYIGLYDGKYVASKITSDGLKQAMLDKELDNITKFKYDNISYINHGIFTFKRDETVGLLNGEGKEIYSFKVDEVDDKNINIEVSNTKSSTKYAKVKVNDSTTIINLTTGKEVYNYTLNEISVLDNNVFSVRDPKYDNNTYLYIKDDEVVYQTNKYKYMRVDSHNSNIALCIKPNSRIDYINLTNGEIMNSNDNNEYYYNDGVLLEKTHDFNMNADVYNIIDYTGKIGSFVSLKPEDNLFYNGMLKIVVFENTYNFVNTKGKTITNKSYEYAENFAKNGYAVVANNGKYGILDTKAEEIVSLSYVKIEQLDNDFFSMLKNKYGLELFIFTNGNSKQGFVNSNNKEYIEAIYSSFEIVDDDYPFVKAYYGSDAVLLNLVNKKEISLDKDSLVQIKDNYVIVDNKYYNYNGKLIYTVK